MPDKKPFKETQVGQWITKNVPALVNTIENFVPAPIKGGIEVIKNLVGLQPGVTAEQTAEFNKLADDFELSLIQLHNEEMANARASNVQIQSSAQVPNIVKLRPTILSFFVAIIWGTVAIYIIATILNLIKRDPSTNFESVLALFTAISVLFDRIISFDFGSTSGSKSKDDTIAMLSKQN